MLPEGLDVLLRRVEGRVIDGKHAVRLGRHHRAEDELSGPVGLFAEQEVQEGQLVNVIRQSHVAVLKSFCNVRC